MAKSAPRIPISTILIYKVAKGIKRLYRAKKVYLVGSRLRHKYGRDLDFTAEVDGSLAGRNVTFKVGQLSVNVFFASHEDIEATTLEFSLGLDSIRWKRKARSMGLVLNRYGLWYKGTRVTAKAKEIAAVLGMQLKPFVMATLENPL